MAGVVTNPDTGKNLAFGINPEALHPSNNLADVRSKSACLTNLDVTATAAELSLLASTPASVSIALAASATTDGMDITVTAKDAAGATLAATCEFILWMSESAVGAGLTADTYSGTLTAGTGAILGTLTAKKCFLIQTHTTGVFVGTLVDSANPADQYVVVQKPVGAGRVVSAASGTNWEGV